jgi:large subunit ribosomal protein L4e
MFAPLKIWRRWHRKVNTTQKRHAVASALAASALPSLVLARGHKVEQVPELPLVLSNAVESVVKTKDAVAVLQRFGAYVDVEKVKDSKKLRRGKGKMRGRRYVQRRGPLVVYSEDNGITQAFRNLPGVELAQVDRLNILQLAPGGHVGRFVIFTQGAFKKLDHIFGTYRKDAEGKKDYKLPRSVLANADLARIINSDEVQTAVRPAVKATKGTSQKKNPLVNLGAMVKLNPHALTARRLELLSKERRSAATQAKVDEKRKGITAAASKKK